MSSEAEAPVQEKKSGGIASNIRWIVLALASITSGMLYLHRYTWNVIRPELAREYGFSNTELEQIFTLFNFTYAFGQIPGGIICDFFGAHLFLGSIILIWSVSLILFALVGTFWTFAGLRLVFGAAQAGAYPSLSNITRTWFAPSTRTTVQGFVASTSGRAGGALAPIIMATVLMGYFGLTWQVALIVMASLGIFFAAAFLVLFRNSPEMDKRVNQEELALIREGSEAVRTKQPIMRFSRAAKNRSFLILVFQQFSNAGADIVYTSVMGSFFLSKNISMGEMGVYASFPMWGGALGGFVGGYLNDFAIRKLDSRKWGRSIMGFLGKAIAAACLFVAISQTSPLALAIGLFVVKFFSDWSQPTVWGTCTDLGGRHSATTFSIVNTTGNIGALCIPLVVGPLLDHYETVQIINGVEQTVTNYVPMFILVAALYLVSAVCWLLIDCTKPIDPDPA